MERSGRTRKWVVAGTVAALVAVAALAWRGNTGNAAGATPGRAGPATTAGTAADRGQAASAGAGERVEPSAVPSGPLPAVGTPFRLTLDELQRRARAGDAAAMCRLAAEHADCVRIRASLAVTSMMLDVEQARIAAGQDGRDQPRRRSWTTERGEALLEESRHCEGVPPITDRELVRQWRAAALAGSLPALEHYALGQAFEIRSLLSVLPELELYRRDAEAMAWRAVEAGSRTATRMLGMAYMPDAHESGFAPFLTQAVEPDAVEALAMLRVALKLGDPPGIHDVGIVHAVRIAQLEERMTPAQRTLAAQRTAQIEALHDNIAAGPRGARGSANLAEACSAPGATGLP